MTKKIITITGFKGGLANSLYEPLDRQTYQVANDLDVFTYPNVITPVVNLKGQTTSPAMSSAKIGMLYKASNGSYYVFGDSGTSNQLRAWTMNFTSGTATLNTVGTGAANGAPVYSNRFHVVEIAGYLLFWNVTLGRITLSDNTFTADPYTWSPSGPSSAPDQAPIFVHEGLGKVFMAYGYNVYYLTTTNVSGSADPTLGLALDPKYTIKSMCAFGRFVLIGAQAINDSTTSKVFVWDGSATTVDDVIDVGDNGLQAIRNLNGVIHILSCQIITGRKSNVVREYLWGGYGSVVLGDEYPLNSATASTNSPVNTTILDTAVDVFRDRLHFGFAAFTNTQPGYIGVTNGIYTFGRLDPQGPRVTNLFMTTTGTSTDCNYTNIKAIDGGLICLYNNGTTYSFETTFSNSTDGARSARGVFQSNLFRLSDLGKGRITGIRIQHDPMIASTGFTVKVRQYGTYPDNTTVPTPMSLTTVGSQTTTSATYTYINNFNNLLTAAEWAQIEIDFDTVSGTSAPSVVFPIVVEVEVGDVSS